MLHVDRGIDIDAGVEQLVDVLPALLVARRRIPAADIGMRELIDQHKARLALQGGVQIELAALGAAKLHLQWWQLLEPDQQALGLLAAVQFDITDHDVRAFAPPALRGLQHGVAFANAGIGAKENSELPASLARLPGLQSGQQLIRIGAVIVHCASSRRYLTARLAERLQWRKRVDFLRVFDTPAPTVPVIFITWGRHGRRVSAIARRPVRRHARPGQSVRASGQATMTGMYWLSGLLALFLFGYLLYALIKAERF